MNLLHFPSIGKTKQHIICVPDEIALSKRIRLVMNLIHAYKNVYICTSTYKRNIHVPNAATRTLNIKR